MACIRIQCSASLQPIRSSASANAADTPAWPFNTRDSATRPMPNRLAVSVTDHPSASTLSRINSPRCGGLYIVAMAASVSMVVDQVHVYGLRSLESEHHAPVARDPNAPLSTPGALQRVKVVARHAHVAWPGRTFKPVAGIRRSRDTRSVESPKPAVLDLHVTSTVLCNDTLWPTARGTFDAPGSPQLPLGPARADPLRAHRPTPAPAQFPPARCARNRAPGIAPFKRE